MISTNISKSLSCPRLWLLGIGTGLIAIHLTLVTKANQDELFSTSFLYWFAIGAMIWQRREELRLKSNGFSTLLGATLISLILFKSLAVSGSPDLFLRLLPLLSILGLGLVASGFRGVQQYWQELIVMSFLIPHSGWLSNLFDLSELTAKVSAALLLYVGFDVSQQGSIIALPKGFVGVNPGCSGYSSIMQLLGISVIFLLMFSVPLVQRIIVPLVAIFIAFIVNAVRVAVLSVLTVETNKDGFIYWHNEEGSLLFSLISVSLFGLFCLFLIQQNESIEEQE